MPVFPASFSPPVSSSLVVSGAGSGLSPCRPVVPMPRCGVAVTVAAAEAAKRLYGERRPCSDVVTTTCRVSDSCADQPPFRAPRSHSVGALITHQLPPPPSPPPARLTLSSLLTDLQTALRELESRYPSLQALMDQLTAVDQLIKVILCLLCLLYVTNRLMCILE